jgi:hypothetical protein
MNESDGAGGEAPSPDPIPEAQKISPEATCDGMGPKFGNDCGKCLESQCCKQLADSGGDPLDGMLVYCSAQACPECMAIGGPFPAHPSCTMPPAVPSGGECVQRGGGIECNPVTNEGCGLGAVCDVALGGFACYTSGNVHDLCDHCGEGDDDYCKARMTCGGDDSACYRFCCTDDDCAGGAKCATGEFETAPGVGLCGFNSYFPDTWQVNDDGEGP